VLGARRSELHRDCPRRHRVVAGPLVLILALSAALAAGPAAASSDSTGTFADTCVDARTGTPFEFHAKHLLASSAIDSTWTPSSTPLCVGSLDGLQGNVLADGAGGAYVGWVDHRQVDPDIYLRRLTGTGETTSGWPADGLPVCRAPYSQSQLDLAKDGSGGVFLAWQDYRDGGVGRVFVQHISAQAEVVTGWPAEGRAVTDTAVEQSAPRLASDGSGGVYVVWQGRRGRLLDVHGQRLTASGAAASGWPANGVLMAGGASEHRSPAIASDSLGRALVVWQLIDTVGAQSLAALRIDSEANPQAGWNPTVLTLSSSATELSDPAVERAGGASMLVAWGEWRGGISAMRAQRVSLDGLSAEWTAGGLALCEGPISREAPRVVTDVQGGFVAWTDFRGGGNSDIYVQRFTHAGAVGTDWPANGVAVAANPGEEYAPWLASDGVGGALVTWSEPEIGVSAGYVSLTRLLQQGRPRLLEAVARPNQVRVVWQLACAMGESLAVERRLSSEAWQALSRVACDDSGRVTVVDRSAPEGTHVEYRLGITIEDALVFFEPAGLDIPRAPLVLALHRARMDSGRNAVIVSFALPAGADPALELIDVTGRRMARQVLTGLDPGEHEETVSISSRLPAGVYFLRLMQAGQIRTAKLALVR
jgi:hypothetical protein